LALKAIRGARNLRQTPWLGGWVLVGTGLGRLIGLVLLTWEPRKPFQLFSKKGGNYRPLWVSKEVWAKGRLSKLSLRLKGGKFFH